MKGGGPLILGMGDDPRTKDLTDYKKEKTGGKRKVRKTLKKKSLKKKKSLRKRK